MGPDKIFSIQTACPHLPEGEVLLLFQWLERDETESGTRQQLWTLGSGLDSAGRQWYSEEEMQIYSRTKVNIQVSAYRSPSKKKKGFGLGYHQHQGIKLNDVWMSVEI